MTNINELIESALVVRGVDPKLFSEIPIFLRRSIVRLQSKGILEDSVTEFLVEEKKDIKLDAAGELHFYYLNLPLNFGELKYLWVKDSAQKYQYVPFDEFDGYENLYKWTITRIELAPGEPIKPVLLLTPFPADGTAVSIRYKISTDDYSLQHIDEKYWEPLIADVLDMYGVGSAIEAQEYISDLRRSQLNPGGTHSGSSGNGVRKMSYFGKING